jgi:hypothetical protein
MAIAVVLVRYAFRCERHGIYRTDLMCKKSDAQALKLLLVVDREQNDIYSC